MKQPNLGWIKPRFFLQCWTSLSNNMKLLPKIAGWDHWIRNTVGVCVSGNGIEEIQLVYALCCQSNEAFQKTEVGPYRKYEQE